MKFLAQIAPGTLAWILSLVCPAVPQWAWYTIIKAVLAGNLTLDHLQAFFAAHQIKTYYAPTDFPDSPPQQETPNNLTVTQPPS